ncbi:MAG: hypothetical protein GF401_03910 [Chitinivibrionales bacterium]|nr:hypothetical protein [Chitinivibrionales bacterium]
MAQLNTTFSKSFGTQQQLSDYANTGISARNDSLEFKEVTTGIGCMEYVFMQIEIYV